MIWREPKDYVTDCYFCFIPPIKKGITKKKRMIIQYLSLSSVIRPVLHSDKLPFPNPPQEYILDSNEDSRNDVSKDITQPSTSRDPQILSEVSSAESHKISQTELSDLIRDLNLSKKKAELLASRLQQWNLLKDKVKVSIYRNRQKDFTPFF